MLPSIDARAFGKRLNKIRKERKLTSEKLAELCFINATYLRQIESGMKTPSMQVFVLLCQTLRVSPNYLLPELTRDTEVQHFELLQQLWEKATLDELRLITGILQGALDSLPRHGPDAGEPQQPD